MANQLDPETLPEFSSVCRSRYSPTLLDSKFDILPALKDGDSKRFIADCFRWQSLAVGHRSLPSAPRLCFCRTMPHPDIGCLKANSLLGLFEPQSLAPCWGARAKRFEHAASASFQTTRSHPNCLAKANRWGASGQNL